jgi:hypothetical protein
MKTLGGETCLARFINLFKIKEKKIMKNIIAIIFMAALCVYADDVSQKDKAKWRLSVRTSTSRAISAAGNLSEMSVDQKAVFANYLKTEMLENVAEYKNPESAEKKLYSKIEAKKHAEYDEILEQISKQATETSPIQVTVEDIIKMGGDALVEAKKSKTKSFMDANYKAIFDVSRKEAITNQKKEIAEIAIFPNYAILNDFFVKKVKTAPLMLSKEQQQLLNKEVLKEVENTKSVFDELEGYVKHQNTVVNTEIDYQLNFRRKNIEESLNSVKQISNIYNESLIFNYVSNNLAKVVKDNYKDYDTTIPKYDLFTPNIEYIQKKSKEIEQIKLINFINSADLKITEESIVSKVKADLSEHQKIDASKILITDRCLKEAPAVLKNQYVKFVGIPESSEFLLTELDKQEKSYETLKKKVEQQLKVTLPSARFVIVEEQLAEFFPRSLDETNFEESDIIDYYKSESLGIDKMDDVFSFYKIPEEKSKEISPILLEETRAKVILITKKRLEEQLESLKTQLSILYNLETEQKDLLKESIREGKTKDELFISWMQKIKAEYLTEYPKIAEKFPEIYQYVQDELKKIISQYFDAVEKEQQQQQEQKVLEPEISSVQSTSQETEEIIEKIEPEEEEIEEVEKEQEEVPSTVQEDKGITEDMKEILGMADCLIVFSDLDDGNSKVAFLLPSSGLVVEEVFNPEDIEASAEDIGGAIGQYLNTIVEGKTSSDSSLFGFGKKDEKSIKIFVLIKSNRTRHLMTVILRKNLIDNIKKLSNEKQQKLLIHWEEAL